LSEELEKLAEKIAEKLKPSLKGSSAPSHEHIKDFFEGCPTCGPWLDKRIDGRIEEWEKSRDERIAKLEESLKPKEPEKKKLEPWMCVP